MAVPLDAIGVRLAVTFPAQVVRRREETIADIAVRLQGALVAEASPAVSESMAVRDSAAGPNGRFAMRAVHRRGAIFVVRATNEARVDSSVDRVARAADRADRPGHRGLIRVRSSNSRSIPTITGSTPW
ncbi:hypothetical protein ASA1KI_33890 [Opitutales bacterium ASA1]|uniref:hypothetical protein n=1 Tax=Congregicoccus parvus TaxID=3081749 RepID=UPI002B2B138B|nr:hypothetical protein ASA1KI_33890 [Opitutales bacterium ASA1]